MIFNQTVELEAVVYNGSVWIKNFNLWIQYSKYCSHYEKNNGVKMSFRRCWASAMSVRLNFSSYRKTSLLLRVMKYTR